MGAFDDLTLGEVDDIAKECLDGKSFSDPDVDPLKLAGAVMWMAARKNGEPNVTWDEFRYKTKMSEIKAFSEAEMTDAVDPTIPPAQTTN